MGSGFPGGGGLPGLYGDIGRSMGASGAVQIGNSLIGNPNNMGMYRYQQQPQQQQQQSVSGLLTMDKQSQIGGGHRGPESTMIGKRSLAQFQSSFNTPSSSSPSNFLWHQRQQQQQLSFLQQQQQPPPYLQQSGIGGGGQQQQQYQQQILRQNHHAQLLQQQQQPGLGGQLLRSVKQRTTNNTTSYHHNQQSSSLSPLSAAASSSSLSSNSSSARLGVPLYNPQSQLRLNPLAATNYTTCCSNNSSSAAAAAPTITNQGPSIGYSNLCPNRPDPENKKQIMSLEDLEKELLGDDDDFDGLLMGSGGDGEGDAVSVITNSDWSETFQLLSPTQNNNSATTTTTMAHNNNSCTTTTMVLPTATATTPVATTIPNNNNNNTHHQQQQQISPSPTSSTSSSCSSSATPPPPLPPCTSAKQLISEAAMAISEGKTEESADILTRLSQISNQRGTADQKLAFYMLHALRCRASPAENPPPVTELFSAEHASSFRALCDLSPCFKYPLLAANLAILDTIEQTIQESRRATVHIVDFDIGAGDQHANLLRAMPATQAHALDLRITAVDIDERKKSSSGRSSSSLEGVRDTLTKLADRTGMISSFRFHSVVVRAIPELTRELLGCDQGETLVVNFAYRLFRVPDESVSMENLRDELLRRVKGMYPRLLMLVEQEMNVNTAPFTTRAAECGAYYAEVIDSLGDSSDATKAVEEGLGRKAANTVACEGRERVERCELFGKWRARMGMAGFAARNLISTAQAGVDSMRAKLCDPGRGANPKFLVKEDGFGGVCFGWNGRTLTVASAWR